MYDTSLGGSYCFTYYEAPSTSGVAVLGSSGREWASGVMISKITMVGKQYVSSLIPYHSRTIFFTGKKTFMVNNL